MMSNTNTGVLDPLVSEVIAALREMERLKAKARIMGAVSPDGHITRGIERHALARIAAAVGETK